MQSIVRSIKDLPSGAGANILLGKKIEDVYIITLDDQTLRICLKNENNDIFAIDTHSKEVGTAVIRNQNLNN